MDLQYLKPPIKTVTNPKEFARTMSSRSLSTTHHDGKLVHFIVINKFMDNFKNLYCKKILETQSIEFKKKLLFQIDMMCYYFDHTAMKQYNRNGNMENGLATPQKATENSDLFTEVLTIINSIDQKKEWIRWKERRHTYDCRITVDVETFSKICTGKLKPISAFLSGKLKFDGERNAFTAIGSILKESLLTYEEVAEILNQYDSEHQLSLPRELNNSQSCNTDGENSQIFGKRRNLVITIIGTSTYSSNTDEFGYVIIHNNPHERQSLAANSLRTSFVTQYTIETFDTISKNTWQASHRFSRFLSLRKILVDKQRYTNIPQIRSRTAFFKNSESLVRHRVQYLTAFLQDVLRSVGHQNETFCRFLGISMEGIGMMEGDSDADSAHASHASTFDNAIELRQSMIKPKSNRTERSPHKSILKEPVEETKSESKTKPNQVQQENIEDPIHPADISRSHANQSIPFDLIGTIKNNLIYQELTSLRKSVKDLQSIVQSRHSILQNIITWAVEVSIIIAIATIFFQISTYDSSSFSIKSLFHGHIPSISNGYQQFGVFFGVFLIISPTFRFKYMTYTSICMVILNLYKCLGQPISFNGLIWSMTSSPIHFIGTAFIIILESFVHAWLRSIVCMILVTAFTVLLSHDSLIRTLYISCLATSLILFYTILQIITKRILKLDDVAINSIYETVDSIVVPFIVFHLGKLKSIFVKFAQYIGGRADFVSSEWTDALSTLHDACPPSDPRYVRKMLGAELQKTFEIEDKLTIEELFDEFDWKPLASASIGQVHVAKLNIHHLSKWIQKSKLEKEKTSDELIGSVSPVLSAATSPTSSKQPFPNQNYTTFTISHDHKEHDLDSVMNQRDVEVESHQQTKNFSPEKLASASSFSEIKDPIEDEEQDWQNKLMDNIQKIGQTLPQFVSHTNVEGSVFDLSSTLPVVVKIQHENIANIMISDMKIVRYFVGIACKLDKRWKIMQDLMKSWEVTMRDELNFKTETSNLKEMGNILQKSEIAAKMPVPVESLVTEKVLVMSRMYGYKVSDKLALNLHGVDKSALLSRIAHACSWQLLVAGVFNADPHPGNLMFCLSNSSGADPVVVPGLLDFGMTVRLSVERRKSYCRLVVALFEGDVQLATQALKEIGYKNTQTDRAPERDAEFFEYLFRDAGTKNVAKREQEQFTEKRKAQKLEDTANGSLEKGGRRMDEIPEDFLFLTRVIGLLRGLTAELKCSCPILYIMAMNAKIGLE